MTGRICTIRRSNELTRDEVADIRTMLDAAFGGEFTDQDWVNTLGGHHVMLFQDGAIASHAAVIARELQIASAPLHAGYVESVATRSDIQRRGLGLSVMKATGAFIRANYELGGLSTGQWPFYQRLGWERWEGHTYVRSGEDLVRTPEDDDSVMVLRFGKSAAVDLRSSISCEARSGDVW